MVKMWMIKLRQLEAFHKVKFQKINHGEEVNDKIKAT